MLKELIEGLRHWSVWKRIEAAPDRIDALERRIAALEARLADGGGAVCPSCAQRAFGVVSSLADPLFGPLGGRRVRSRCRACGYEHERLEA
jgi:hypothetical protein